MTNTDRIRKTLELIFGKALARGDQSIEITSGKLHELVDFKPGSHPNQMPSVCNVMHEFCKSGDVVMHKTPSGKSSTLKIKYRLPR